MSSNASLSAPSASIKLLYSIITQLANQYIKLLQACTAYYKQGAN